MAIINRARLLKYLELNYNVLFKGVHGVGKTEIIKSVFNEAGLRWKYFSAATLDPWVDLVGIPKVFGDGDNSVMRLVRPEFIVNDEVDAIFIDEFNRAADKKVLNAVMELLQFKSINGHKLNNLKVIWAAINPEDEEDTYLVNHVDPAQLDRFQIHIDVPYKVDREYFVAKYPDHGRAFVDWWNDLPGDLQKLVSPRRLDYAAHAFINDCRIEDILPPETLPKKLREMLKALPFAQQIQDVGTLDEATTFLRDPNNAMKILDLVKAGDTVTIDFFRKYGEDLPKELTDPVLEWLKARQSGFETVGSIEEMIEKMPGDKGTAATAGLINNVALDLLYQKGGNLTQDIKGLYHQKANLVRKLATRCDDIIISCNSKTLMRVFWGPGGKEKGHKTNFHKIMDVFASMGGTDLFSEAKKRAINNKLYSNRIVDGMHYL